MKSTTKTAGIALVTAGLGFALGRLSAPGPVALQEPEPSSAAATQPSRDDTGPAPGDEAGVPTDAESLEGFLGMGKRAIDLGADPNALVRGAMDQMSDEQLISLITSLTDYDREELEAVHDVRAFVSRLAEVAMDGTLAPARDLPPDLGRIEFAVDVRSDNSAVHPGTLFRSDDPRIYAVFRSDDLAGEQVFAKWVRVADGEVLLFGRYRIEPGDDYSYVWMGRPGQAWEPGTYRVDFYTADDRLDLLASGTHTISP